MDVMKSKRAVFYETYGCQMNSNDTDLVRSIMHEANYAETDNVTEVSTIVAIAMPSFAGRRASHNDVQHTRESRRQNLG